VFVAIGRWQRMNGADRMQYVGVEAGGVVAADASVALTVQSGEPVSDGLGVLKLAEASAVLGARIGACIFNSLTLPAILWALGGLEVATACVAAAVLTLLGTRSILVFGGTRIGRLMTLQIFVSLSALYPSHAPLSALLMAIFIPLVGTFLSVSICSRLADVPSSDDQVLLEADAVVARASQPNVVDIRAAGVARRAGTRVRAQAPPTDSVVAASGNTIKH
jgi:hypothetical protein